MQYISPNVGTLPGASPQDTYMHGPRTNSAALQTFWNGQQNPQQQQQPQFVPNPAMSGLGPAVPTAGNQNLTPAQLAVMQHLMQSPQYTLGQQQQQNAALQASLGQYANPQQPGNTQPGNVQTGNFGTMPSQGTTQYVAQPQAARPVAGYAGGFGGGVRGLIGRYMQP